MINTGFGIGGSVKKSSAIINGSTEIKVVTELPSSGNGNTIYLVRNTNTTGDNLYNEYIFVNGNWELIGVNQSDVPLEDYYTKEDIDKMIEDNTNEWRDA